jgi:hypothetical protein
MAEVSTGYSVGEPVRWPSGPRTVHSYVFTPDSPLGQVYSHRVVLVEEMLYLFRVYNIPDGRSIYMNLVSQENAGPPPGGGCLPGEYPTAGGDLYLARMTLGGADKWIISAQRPQMLVNLPGVYRFELEDEDMLGADLCLEYSAVRCVPGVVPGVVL